MQFDAVLIECRLCDLLENAGKYSPVVITVSISYKPPRVWLNITVVDGGARSPAAQEEVVFEKFILGKREAAKHKADLGLA